jgi:hypothetical protein
VVPDASPEIALVKVPVPVPSEVLLFAIVGPVAVPQQTPLAVTGDPPSEVMLPPLLKLLAVIRVASIVVNVGPRASVVNEKELL